MSFQFDRVYPQGPVAPTSSKLRTDLVKADEFTSSYLDRGQIIAELGDTIPVVFCKREDAIGGVFVSPPAVRMGYTTTCKTISGNVACVVTDGECPAIARADVWMGTEKNVVSPVTSYGSIPSWVNGLINAPKRVYTETTSYQTSPVASGVPAAGPPVGGWLNGSGSIVVSSKTDRCKSFVARVGGLYQLQGFGNGLDGYPATMSGASYQGTATAPDPENYRSHARLLQRSYVSGFVPCQVQWTQNTVRDTNPDYPLQAAYEVTFNKPRRSASVLYPGNAVAPIPPTTTQKNIDTWLSQATAGAGDNVRALSSVAYSGSRGTGYIGSGTTLDVVADDFVVHVTEINEYDCPLADGIPQTGGTGGSFAGLTMLSVSRTSDIELGLYLKQIHAFIRNGIIVPRLIEGTNGSSNLLPDLVRYFMLSCARVPAQLVDDDRLRSAAQFCQANSLFFNGAISTNANLREWVMQVAPFYLLQMTQVDGRFGLKPALPVDGASISTQPVTPVLEFTGASIIAGSFTRASVDAASLAPFAALVLWRDQPDNAPGMVKTLEVRYAGSAVDGPYETYDGSEFVTSQDHATKAGRFFLAQRRHITHTASWQSSIQASALNPGDVVRVTLSTENSKDGAGIFTELYQIDSIEETLGGLTTINASLFPIDEQGRSLVALDVVGGSFS